MYITAPNTQSVSPAENKTPALKSPGGQGDHESGFLGQMKRINQQAAENQHHDLNCDDKDESDSEHNIEVIFSGIEEHCSKDFILQKVEIKVMPESESESESESEADVSKLDTSLADAGSQGIMASANMRLSGEEIIQSSIADSRLAGEMIGSAAEMKESKPADDFKMQQGFLKAAGSGNLQESDDEQTVKVQFWSAGKSEIKDDADKSRSRNRITSSGRDTAKIKQDIQGEMTITNHNNPDSKNNVDTELKKVIEFEAHRVKAEQLPTAAESGKQDAGSNSQAMLDKPQLFETKQINSETNLQDNFKTSVNPKDVIKQIVEKAEMIRGKNSSEIKIDLKPDFLGKMTIKLVVEEGGLTAKFITDNLHVKNMLESNLHVLKQTLENQGIKVEKTEVNVQLNNGGMFDGSEGNQQEPWQNQKYMSERLKYIEEIDMTEELFIQEIDHVDYAGTGIIVENSMNFLV